MIYLDHNATTLIHKDVKHFMINMLDKPLNASSIHTSGRSAKGLIENARMQILDLLQIEQSSRDYQVIFTSSGTEANNLVISNFHDSDIFITEIEHQSIFENTKYLSNIKKIQVDNNGVVDLDCLKMLLSESVAKKKLVSVMLANNETGVIQPIKKVAEIALRYGALVHSDCIQGVGKILVNVKDLGVDFATISAHKFGGPVGAAALIARSNYNLQPAMIGGGQERGIRSGTENVIAIAGFGLAASIAKNELVFRKQIMRNLQERLERNLPSDAKIIASNVDRLPNTSLISLGSGFDALTQVIAFDLRGIEISAGAACSSGKVRTSHVLKAMKIDEIKAKSAIRVSTSQYNNENEIDEFIKAFNEINKIRRVA